MRENSHKSSASRAIPPIPSLEEGRNTSYGLTWTLQDGPQAPSYAAFLPVLGVKGFLRVVVEEALTSYRDWMPHLHTARQKKFGAQLPTHYPDKQRQARFLAYRGYTGAQIRMALGVDTDIDVES